MRTLCSLFILLFPLVSISQVGKDGLDAFVKDPAFKSASISFELVEVSTGKSILSFDRDRVLITASTAKLFSTATAMEMLGPDFRSETRIYTEGSIDENGILHGNLWIRGAGDASLGSKYFNEANKVGFLKDWATQLQQLGIRSIEGSVIADASEFGYFGAPDGWSWGDLGNYYGAGPSGLTIYDNQIEYTFDVPSKFGATSKLIRMQPEIPGLFLRNNILASESKGDNAYIYGAPYSFDRFGEGTLPAGSKSFVVKGSIPDPELFFAMEMERALNELGISVQEDPKTTRTFEQVTGDPFYSNMRLLHAHKGTTLLEIIKETNYRSVNLFAEHMLTLVGRYKGKAGTTHEGIKVAEDFWRSKIQLEGIRIADGSGLSRSNAISAHHFTELLNYMYTSENGKAFFSTLPVTGQSGTMSGMCKDQRAEGKISAKSGSINGVRSYAGYIRGESGKLYSFALIVNNADCSSSVLKRKMEILFNALVSY